MISCKEHNVNYSTRNFDRSIKVVLIQIHFQSGIVKTIQFQIMTVTSSC